MTTEKSTWVECECGTHVIRVSTDTEIYENGIDDVVTDKPRIHQTYYLAMFNYAEHKPDSWWKRIRTSWRYMRTGKMHGDQIVMTPQEAYKLSKFITDEMSMDALINQENK